MGTTNPFNSVELSNPPKITCAMGLWISFPGRSPPRARGIKANADVRAVIRMGFRRSNEPWIILSVRLRPSFCNTKQGNEADNSRDAYDT